MNPHEGSTSSVFETDASAYSATPAFFQKAGGVDGIRTHGFYLAKVTLSQLSYDPNNSDVLYHKGIIGSSTSKGKVRCNNVSKGQVYLSL